MVFKVFTTAGNQRQCYAHGVAATSCCKSKYVDFIASIQVEWHTTILQPKEMMNINVEKMSWALIALMSALTDKYNYVNIYAYVCMVCETFLLQQSFQIYINIYWEYLSENNSELASIEIANPIRIFPNFISM